MGIGGICIHYTPSVVSEGVRRLEGPRSSSLSSFFSFFSIPFSVLSFCVWGVCWERGLGCLSPHLSVPPGIPYCHSNPRPLTGAQIRDQRISDFTCVCVRKVAKRVCVCVCVTEAVTSMSLCCPARNLSPRGGRLEGDTSCKIQTHRAASPRNSSYPSVFGPFDKDYVFTASTQISR